METKFYDPIVRYLLNKAVEHNIGGLPVKTMADTLLGKKDAITQNDFNPEQLKIIAELVRLKGGDSGAINYQDYKKLAAEKGKEGNYVINDSPGLFSVFDPFGQVQTTLGQFDYNKLPNGQLQIKDNYDFNNSSDTIGPLAPFLSYGKRAVPEGQGRPVNLMFNDPLAPTIK